MRFLGIEFEGYFHRYQLTEDSPFGLLITYTEDTADGVEVLILYDKQCPFLIRQIGVQLDDSTYYGVKPYSVWSIENNEVYESDEECQNVARYFAIEIIKFQREALRHLENAEKIRIINHD